MKIFLLPKIGIVDVIFWVSWFCAKRTLAMLEDKRVPRNTWQINFVHEVKWPHKVKNMCPGPMKLLKLTNPVTHNSKGHIICPFFLLNSDKVRKPLIIKNYEESGNDNSDS